MTACVVCEAPIGSALYHIDASTSVSSTARALVTSAALFVCEVCGHVQTGSLGDVDGYYDTEYNVHLESDEADDLYTIRDGVPIYRSRYQAEVALDKLTLRSGARVLDYGSGKGMSIRALLGLRPDIAGAVFDVSDAYRTSWDDFLAEDSQATYRTPDSWAQSFDAVMSFFALEHVVDPRAFLVDVHRMLGPNGNLHLVVPNVRRNIGDFIVADHVNHFVPTSLRYLLTDTAFCNIRIDEDVHEGTFVVSAQRGAPSGSGVLDAAEVTANVDEAHRCAAFWSGARTAVETFERERGRGRPSAIYGSGFYGVFIGALLAQRGGFAYFLDRNPHQQEKRIFDRPVLAPEAIGDDIEVVYAALNPARARGVIAETAPLQRRAREYFYL